MSAVFGAMFSMRDLISGAVQGEPTRFPPVGFTDCTEQLEEVRMATSAKNGTPHKVTKIKNVAPSGTKPGNRSGCASTSAPGCR